MDNLSSFLMFGLFVTLAASRHRLLHLAGLPAILAMLILDIMVFKPVLLGKHEITARFIVDRRGLVTNPHRNKVKRMDRGKS